MLHLLKEKSKVQWSAKKKKTYEPLKPGLKLQQPAASQIDSSIPTFKQSMVAIAKKADAQFKK